MENKLTMVSRNSRIQLYENRKSLRHWNIDEHDTLMECDKLMEHEMTSNTDTIWSIHRDAESSWMKQKPDKNKLKPLYYN